MIPSIWVTNSFGGSRNVQKCFVLAGLVSNFEIMANRGLNFQRFPNHPVISLPAIDHGVFHRKIMIA